MSNQKAPGWKEVPQAGVIRDAGNAEDYETGDWRSYRPVRDEDKCIHCLLCWVYCPDSAIIVKDGKVVGIDLKHCKGCGICAKECPEKIKAIKMVKEDEAS
jgi:pyruvate ferredoxin oxidoreductase delta subunit